MVSDGTVFRPTGGPQVVDSFPTVCPNCQSHMSVKVYDKKKPRNLYASAHCSTCKVRYQWPTEAGFPPAWIPTTSPQLVADPHPPQPSQAAPSPDPDPEPEPVSEPRRVNWPKGGVLPWRTY